MICMGFAMYEVKGTLYRMDLVKTFVKLRRLQMGLGYEDGSQKSGGEVVIAVNSIIYEMVKAKLASIVSGLAGREDCQGGWHAVTELEQVKADNRNLRNANETLLAKLTEARLQVEGLQKENQLLEEKNTH
uniref:Uncharacterized protein n=1 Tax=Cannabis sativa TaxID=3483 RepID=A0A803P9Q8_CANSA